jgi:hypothetical protein
MSEMMVGRKVSFEVEKGDIKPGKPVLEVQNLTVSVKGHGKNAVNNVSFKAHEGEIVCIATCLTDTPSPTLRPYLQQTATGKGVELAGASLRQFYGKPSDGIEVESGDTAIAFYRCRHLKLMARHTFFGESGALTLVELRLMRREFPKAWVRPQIAE